ncbi:MAG: hypothetical protein HOC91_13110 [Nitrospinaceae bacterium]|jgi:hypothetical protein|nr:hypothetical protein [Nitrospinaceae bacterium]MBT3433429.1 hypothetical protein [Nitrospinaceae bacterium]MBT3821628.1 hypothetical protein [Nitrospinaceae bacterium]MBT4092550.1 hypothetical protein [Nitrospinaceae bacterium]MBT4431445.1 hypothetical protein [Nitrospinaceae bacterium]
MIYLILGILLVLVSSTIHGPPLLKAAHTFLALRGSREHSCPETKRDARIQIKAARAGWSVLMGGLADIQVKNCTRWPDRRGCNQGCIAEAFEPEDLREEYTPLFEHIA